jgi:hypothetical protein
MAKPKMPCDPGTPGDQGSRRSALEENKPNRDGEGWLETEWSEDSIL